MGSIIFHLSVKETTLQWAAYGSGGERVGSGEVPHQLPELEVKTINLLVDLQRSLIDSVAGGGDMQADLRAVIDEKTYDVVEVLGDHLYQALFPEAILARLAELRKLITPGQLLRIELEFMDDVFASWPWEYLHSPESGGRFMALDTELVLTRALTFRNLSVRKLKTLQPVTVLLVISRPRGLDPVLADPLYDKIKELKNTNMVRLHELIEPEPDGLLDPDYKPVASRANFEAKLTELVDDTTNEDEQPAIIHFVGHGRRLKRGKTSVGQLAFVGKDGKADWMDDKDFADQVARSRNLKLVFLQACESGMPDPQASVSGVAMQVASKSIPAIVAMQAKVENNVATRFACQFYDTLKAGKPIDLAVKDGLKAIEELGDRQKLAFAVPVLYLRSNDVEGLIDQVKRTSAPSANIIPGVSRQEPEQPVLTNCQRCGTAKRRPDQKICTNCRLHFYCANCGHLLDDPLGNFCGECETVIEKYAWSPPDSNP